MTSFQVHDTVTFMKCITECMWDADSDALNTLDHLEGVVRGWLQPEREMQAQLELIQAVSESISSHGL